MTRRKKLRVNLFSGRAVVLMLLAGLFALGGAAGCVCAGLIRDPGGDLLNYVRGYLAFATKEEATVGFLGVFLQSVRIPILTVILGLTALGVIGIPALFAVKGFTLCYAISAFYRLLGPLGFAPAFVLFGLSALVWLPALLELGGHGLLRSYGLLRRTIGDGRYLPGYDGSFWGSCGICATALCLCIGIEYLAVPPLLQEIAWVFLPS